MTYSSECHLEHIIGEDVQTLSRVLNTLKTRIVGEQVVEDIQEETERELVKEVYLGKRLHGKVQPAACLGNGLIQFTNTQYLNKIKYNHYKEDK